MSKQVAFLVVLDQSAGVTTRELVGYIQGEVRAGVGQLDPRDPLFHLDRASVRVTPAEIRNRLVATAQPEMAEELVRRFQVADGALDTFLKVLRT